MSMLFSFCIKKLVFAHSFTNTNDRQSKNKQKFSSPIADQ